NSLRNLPHSPSFRLCRFYRIFAIVRLLRPPMIGTLPNARPPRLGCWFPRSLLHFRSPLEDGMFYRLGHFAAYQSWLICGVWLAAGIALAVIAPAWNTQ